MGSKSGQVEIRMTECPNNISIIDSSSIPAPNEPKFIDVQTAAVGQDSCYTVSFGEGTTYAYGNKSACQVFEFSYPFKEEWNEYMSINFSYPEANTYMFEVCGQNLGCRDRTCER